MPFVRRAIRHKWLGRAYLIMYMLYSEWLVTEQNKMYYSVAGKSGPRTWAAVDFFGRIIKKGFLRIFMVIFGKKATRLRVRMSLNDEKQIAHDLEAAWIVRVGGVGLAIPLAAGELHLLGIDDDDEIAGIDVRGVVRAVLAAENGGNRDRKPADHLVGSVDHEPLLGDLPLFGESRAHGTAPLTLRRLRRKTISVGSCSRPSRGRFAR